MSLNQHPDTLYQLMKERWRDLDQELAAVKLAHEAQHGQPGLIKTVLRQGNRLFKALVLRLERGFRQRGSRLYREADQSVAAKSPIHQ